MPTIEVAGLTLVLSNVPASAVTQVKIQDHGVFGFNPATRTFWLWGASKDPVPTLGLSAFHDKAIRLALIKHSDDRDRRFRNAVVVERAKYQRLSAVPPVRPPAISPDPDDAEPGDV